MSQDPFSVDQRLFIALEKKSQPFTPPGISRILFNQGEEPKGLYTLKSGEVALTMYSSTGNLVMCHRASAGAVLGLPAVIASKPYSLNAIVSDSSEVGFVTRCDFEQILQSDPSLYLSVLGILAAEVRAARKSLADC